MGGVLDPGRRSPWLPRQCLTSAYIQIKQRYANTPDNWIWGAGMPLIKVNLQLPCKKVNVSRKLGCFCCLTLQPAKPQTTTTARGLTQNDISGGKKQEGGLRAITEVRNAPDDNRRHLGRGRPDQTSPPGGSQASISSTAA